MYSTCILQVMGHILIHLLLTCALLHWFIKSKSNSSLVTRSVFSMLKAERTKLFKNEHTLDENVLDVGDL